MPLLRRSRPKTSSKFSPRSSSAAIQPTCVMYSCVERAALTLDEIIQPLARVARIDERMRWDGAVALLLGLLGLLGTLFVRPRRPRRAATKPWDLLAVGRGGLLPLAPSTLQFELRAPHQTRDAV